MDVSNHPAPVPPEPFCTCAKCQNRLISTNSAHGRKLTIEKMDEFMEKRDKRPTSLSFLGRRERNRGEDRRSCIIS
jgi:hypothetical protein